MISRSEKLRVLYVDDDPDLQQIVKHGLEMSGNFLVKISPSGEQAIVDIPEYKPDLIIIDVIMPGMSGPKTVEYLRQNPDTKELPVIFITSRVQAHQIEQYNRLGAIGIINKPFNPLHLAPQVTTIWEAHHG